MPSLSHMFDARRTPGSQRPARSTSRTRFSKEKALEDALDRWTAPPRVVGPSKRGTLVAQGSTSWMERASSIAAISCSVSEDTGMRDYVPTTGATWRRFPAVALGGALALVIGASGVTVAADASAPASERRREAPARRDQSGGDPAVLHRPPISIHAGGRTARRHGADVRCAGRPEPHPFPHE